MLWFWQDGKKIKIDAINGNGHKGQMVIYGQRIDGLTQISQLPCPAIFTIFDKDEKGGYCLHDVNCNDVIVSNEETSVLYDAREWLQWNNMREKAEKLSSQKEIELLKNNVQLLKDILIKQGGGVHIVTEEQAKKLGLN